MRIRQSFSLCTRDNLVLKHEVGVARNSTALVVGRAVAGVGGAGIASGAYTIIAFAAKPAKDQHSLGFFGVHTVWPASWDQYLGGCLPTN